MWILKTCSSIVLYLGDWEVSSHGFRFLHWLLQILFKNAIKSKKWNLQVSFRAYDFFEHAWTLNALCDYMIFEMKKRPKKVKLATKQGQTDVWNLKEIKMEASVPVIVPFDLICVEKFTNFIIYMSCYSRSQTLEQYLLETCFLWTFLLSW